MLKLKSNKGQTTVEYLLIIMVVVVVIAALGKGMQDRVKKLTQSIFDNIDKQVSSLMKASN